jgi:hypothetical protein
VLGSDESNSSPDEGGSLPYQESNLNNSASYDDDNGDGGGYRIEPSQPPIQFTGAKYQQLYLYSIHTIFLSSLTHAFFSSESQYTHATQDTDHSAPQSQRRPLQTRTDIHAYEGEGEDNNIFPRRRARLLKIQVALCPMPIDSTHTWLPIPHNRSKTCNGSEYENSEFYNMLVE